MNELISRLRPHWKRLLLGLFLALLQCALAFPIAGVLRWAFDVAASSANADKLIQAGALLLGLRTLSSLLACLAHRVQLGVSTRFSADLTRQLLAKVFHVPRLYHQQMETGSLHDLLTAEMTRIDNMVRRLLSQILPYSLLSMSLGLVLILLDTRLFAMMLVLWPVIWLLNEFFRRRAIEATRAYNRAYRSSTEQVRWLLESLDFVRIHHAEPLESRRSEERFAEVEASGKPMAILNVDYLQIQSVLLMALSLAVLLYGGVKVSQHSLTMGSLFSFFMVVGLLNSSLREVAEGLYHLVIGRQSWQNVLDFLSKPISLPYQGNRSIRLSQSLQMQDVSFRYQPEQPLLENFNLRLTPGHQVALTGANGSGKSTVISLLLGFMAPDGGKLCADHIDYAELDIGNLRAQLGVVAQDPLLIAGTIWDNMVYNREHCTTEQVWCCLQLADADSWVKSLPRQLETVVGDAGCRLSGGQRQKLAIARALLGEPAFLILDEPTNHLDLRAVSTVLANLRKLPHSPAVLLVTHDEGVAQAADQRIRLTPKDS